MSRKKTKSPKESRIRFVPRDDGFKIVAIGRRRRWLGDGYVRLLSVPWKQLVGLIVLFYLAANDIFALIYLAIGDGIVNARPGSFADAFFFSVQTMATIGYGNMWPNGLAANLLVTAEALTGFAFFAIVTGLVFAKFSRPTARVMFSRVAVVCPYDGKPHLMLRLANERNNRIVDTNLHMVMLRKEVTREGHEMRRFIDLIPVRSRVPILRLTWTVMHLIDEHSPLYGMTAQSLRDLEAEILVSITGLDETLSQTIHARYSYVADEIVFDASFADVLHRTDDGRLEVNYHHFHEVKPLAAG